MKKLTRQNMICCKLALGKIVAFRVRKFGGFLVFVFYNTKVVLLMTSYHWLSKAEEKNECHFRQLFKVERCEHRPPSKTQRVPTPLLLQITRWKMSKRPFPHLRNWDILPLL